MVEKIFSYVLLTVALIGFIYLAYFSWVKPEEYLEYTRKKRREIMKRGGFNSWFSGPWNNFFDKHRTLDLYSMRIVSLLGIFVGGMIIYVIINGPFHR
jgi:hypothetical protein